MRIRRGVCIGLFVLLIGFADGVSAQTADDLFNDAALHTLQLTINTRDWDTLRAKFTLNDWYPADVTWNGIRARNVAIRSRGLGSRNGVKPGLEVNFAHYNSSSRFLGLRALVLDNMTTDPSMVRERVAMKVYQRFGVPAPREVFAQFYVNGQFAGLYAIVEPIDAVFVQRTLGQSSGALFEYHWLSDYFATFPGESLDFYVPRFEPRTLQSLSTFDLYDPIRELFRTINSAPAETFPDAVNARLDLESTLRLIAGEAVLAEWDGIIGYAGLNNFYLYRNSVTQQAQLLPWDADHAFHQADYPLLAGAFENVLMRRCLEDPALRARFFQLVREGVEVAFGGNWLEQEITTEYLQIRDSVLADTLKPYTNEEFEAAFAELIAFARTRAAFVISQVQQLQ